MRNFVIIPEDFEKRKNAIRLLKDRGVDVKINGSVTRTNRSDMEKIYAIGREFEAPVPYGYIYAARPS